MPFIPAAFAAVSSAITTIAAVAGDIAFTVASTLGAAKAVAGAIALAVQAATPVLIQVGLSMGVAALTTPKIQQRGSPTSWKADPNAGVPYAMGYLGAAGNIVAEFTSAGDNNKFLHTITVLSGCGPCESFESFTANAIAVTFDSAGKATSAPYANRMWRTKQLGTAGDPALALPSGAGAVPEWSADHKMTGYMAFDLAMQFDTDVYPYGPVKPLTTFKGVKVYDPRLDTTYAGGGSGSQRWDDETTWAWSENGPLHALAYIRGRFAAGKKVLGLGADQALIDLTSFVESANVNDDNDWTISGLISSKDPKGEVLKAMGQASGCVIVRTAGTISCLVMTARTPVATLTEDDLAGGCTVPGTQRRADRFNRIIYRYRSEAHNWELQPATAVSFSDYEAQDGGQRTRPVDWLLVRDVHQGAQLAAYSIFNSREITGIKLTLMPQWRQLRPGDVFTAVMPSLGLDHDLMVLQRTHEPQTGLPVVICCTETAAKHPLALALTGEGPPTPSLTSVDPLTIAAPEAGTWSAVGATNTAGDGTSTPAIVVTRTGDLDNARAESVIFEITPHGLDAWQQDGDQAAKTTTRYVYKGLNSGDAYDLGLRYMIGHVRGERLVIPNITAGVFATGGTPDTSIYPTPHWADASASGGSTPVYAYTDVQTVMGIDTATTLQVDWTGSADIEYRKNAEEWISLSSVNTFDVAAGDQVQFRSVYSGAGTATGTVTVTNISQSPDEALDSWDYSNTVSSGVTPSPTPNWNNLSDTGFGTQATGNVQTISGITGSITLLMGFSGDLSDVFLEYRINGGAWNSWIDGTSFSISNGQTLQFRASGGTTSGTATVYNFSDGNTPLDSFSISLIDFT